MAPNSVTKHYTTVGGNATTDVPRCQACMKPWYDGHFCGTGAQPNAYPKKDETK